MTQNVLVVYWDSRRVAVAKSCTPKDKWIKEIASVFHISYTVFHI